MPSLIDSQKFFIFYFLFYQNGLCHFSSQSIWERPCSWRCCSGLRGDGVALMLTTSDDIDLLLEISLVVSEDFNRHNSSVGEEHEGGSLVAKKMVVPMVEMPDFRDNSTTSNVDDGGDKCRIFETIQQLPSSAFFSWYRISGWYANQMWVRWDLRCFLFWDFSL